MKILLIGAKGQLGQSVCQSIPKNWSLFATERAQLNITDFNQVRQVIAEYQPNAIINTAAYTAVDNAERDPQQAKLVNTQGAKYLALAARENNARLIHLSTDYVFDGKSQSPYLETAATSPLNVYGATKLAGEAAISNILPDAIILRTSWIFSEYGNNFVKTMLKLAKQHNELNIISDQYGCPTYAGDIAQAIITLLTSSATGGIYHYCGNQEVNWSGFAQEIFNLARQHHIIITSPKINSLTTAEYPTLAKRPHYSSLNCHKIGQYAIACSDWKQRLQEIMPLLN